VHSFSYFRLDPILQPNLVENGRRLVGKSRSNETEEKRELRVVVEVSPVREDVV